MQSWKRFLLAYVAKFTPNLSDLNAPLRALKTTDKWNWNSEAKQLFDNVKKPTFLNQNYKIL